MSRGTGMKSSFRTTDVHMLEKYGIAFLEIKQPGGEYAIQDVPGYFCSKRYATMVAIP
jgi:hypothetical protein